ncbi:unnamed protein product [Arctia plantaginis]|uniref:Uncharacterized protein n=1 Tax=Arctia plantaginis TaxID=874455 RepID=A0A8S0ZNL3_ARCPL|nr:unnamed protein product [Arctia plantaginis]
MCAKNIGLVRKCRRSASVCSLMDPWGSEVQHSDSVPEFEDNFQPTLEYEKLSDSEQYLAVLERKLKAIRKKNKVVENLAAYRADCIDRLMREGCDLDPVIGDTEDEKLLQDEQE